MGPTDIGSPFACPPENKLTYLSHVSAIRGKMDIVEATYQTHAMQNSKNHAAPSPFFVSKSLKADPRHRAPCYKNSGSIPFLTIEELNRSTNTPSEKEAAYSELIIETNISSANNIAGRLLLLEQHFLDQFNENFPDLLPEYKKSALESLEILMNLIDASDGRWQLAIIKTDMMAYQLKLPVAEQILLLQAEKAEQLRIVKKLQCGKQRLDQAGIPHPYPEDVIESEAKLDQLLLRQEYLEQLVGSPHP